MVLSTKPLTPWLRSPSGAPVPVGATPTSMAMVAGASKLMICQRSTLPGLPNWPRQKGGASMSIIQRVMVAVLSEWVAVNGASATARLPIEEPCT